MVFKSEGFTWFLADIKEQFRRIRCSGQFRLCKFVELFQLAGSEPLIRICKKGLHRVVHRNNIYFVSVFLHPVISEWWKKGEMAGLRAHIIRYNTFCHHQYLILYFRQSQKTFGSAQKPVHVTMTTSAVTFRNLTLQTEKWRREPAPWEAAASVLPLHRNTFGRHCESPPWCQQVCLSLFSFIDSPGLAKSAALVLCTSTSANWGQRGTPGEAPDGGTCLSHGSRGAWAPCPRSSQDTHCPPLLHLPCSWLIQAAQGAGNSPLINPSSPALLFY